MDATALAKALNAIHARLLAAEAGIDSMLTACGQDQRLREAIAVQLEMNEQGAHEGLDGSPHTMLLELAESFERMRQALGVE